MNTPGPDGLSFMQKYERNELPGQSAAAPALTDEQQRAWYELTNILLAKSHDFYFLKFLKQENVP